MNAEIATMISEMCYNPKTDAPFTVNFHNRNHFQSGMIQRAMKDNHVNIKLNQSTKKQALDIIQILKKTMSIERRQMLIQLSCKRSGISSSPRSFLDIEELESLCNRAIGIKVLEKSEKKTSAVWKCAIDTSQYKEFESFCQANKGFACEILSRQYVPQESQESQKSQESQETPESQTVQAGQGAQEIVEEKPAEKSYMSCKFKCSTCEAGFDVATEHREHFRSDWHRYNLKRKNRNLPIMSEAEYNSLDEEDRELFLNQDSIAT